MLSWNVIWLIIKIKFRNIIIAVKLEENFLKGGVPECESKENCKTSQ